MTLSITRYTARLLDSWHEGVSDMSIRLLAMVVLCIRLAGADGHAAESTRSADDELLRRYLLVLERNPRFGTAFDRVYDLLADQGALQEFSQQFWESAELTESKSAWMIAGLVELRRGRAAEACLAFSNAEARQSESALPGFYHARALTEQGLPVLAVAAFERALERPAAAADRLEILQALGRFHQQRGEIDRALAVWKRVEDMFPNDVTVRLQIAETLCNDGRTQDALARYEALVQLARDPAQKLQFQLEVAGLRAHIGQVDRAVEELENLLESLNPESWQFRSVRRRIESVFFQRNAPSSILDYYKHWLTRHPDDVDAIGRLARNLLAQGRRAEARAWLENGLRRAPADPALRRGLIQVHIDERALKAAAEQFRLLDRYQPDDPDTLRDWGRVLLEDSTNPNARAEAVAVWNRLLTARPKDAATCLQVATLFQQSGLNDDALNLFRRAAELAPQDPQYHESLGEHLHRLGRVADAVAAWKEMAAGPRRPLSDFVRLIEVYRRFGYREAAIETCRQGLELAPREFSLHIQLADLQFQSEDHPGCRSTLDAARKLILTDSDREAWVQRDLDLARAVGTLAEQIRKLQERLGNSEQSVDAGPDWYWLARALESVGQPAQAIAAIEQAQTALPESIRCLETAARLYEGEQQWERAAGIMARLALLDRSNRPEHRKRLVQLYEQMGRTTEALALARELSAESPANGERSHLLAQLCFRLGRAEEGLAVLRRSVRSNPSDSAAVLRLTAALIQRNSRSEAIDLLWRAFGEARRLEDRLPLLDQLVTATLTTRLADSVVQRLESLAQDPAQQRDMMLCLAHVHERSGDIAAAFRVLEQLWEPASRDVNLLSRLVALARKQRRPQDAVRYQRQIVDLAPTDAARTQLVQMLIEAGDVQGALRLLPTDGQSVQLTASALKVLDGLASRNESVELLVRLRQFRTQFPENWDLLYREGLALIPSSRAEARDRFAALLALESSLDEPSLLASQSLPAAGPGPLPLLELYHQWAQQGPLVQAQFQFVRGRPSGAARGGPVFIGQSMPPTYGIARISALAWLLQHDQDQVMKQFAAAPRSRRLSIDLVFTGILLNDPARSLAAVRDLVERDPTDIDAQCLYLACLRLRQRVVMQRIVARDGSIQQQEIRQTVAPLPVEELNGIVDLYRNLAARPALRGHTPELLGHVTLELSDAGRAAEAEQLVREAVERADSDQQLLTLFSHGLRDPDLAITQLLLDRLLELQQKSPGRANIAEFLASRIQSQFVSVTSPERALAVLDRYIRLAAAESAANPPRGPLFSARPVLTLRGATGVTTPRGTRVIPGMVRASFGTPAQDPLPACVYSNMARQLLQGTRLVWAGNEQAKGLLEQVARASQQEALLPIERLYWKHAEAFLVWDQQPEVSLKLFVDALQEVPDRDDLKLNVVRQLNLAKQPRQALELLQTIRFTDPADQFDRDTLMLHLLEILGEKEATRLVVEQMIQRGISRSLVARVASHCFRQGLLEEAYTVLVDSRKTEALDLEQARLLLRVELDLQRNDEAAETAEDLLQRFSSPEARRQVAQSTPPTPGVVRDLERECFEALARVGHLQSRIDKAEVEFAASPDSKPALDLLIKYHIAAGNKSRVRDLETTRLKMQAETPRNRFALAAHYLENGQKDEAVEVLSLVLNQDPDSLGTSCRELLFRLDRSESARREFAQLLARLNWGHSESSLKVLPSLVEPLHSQPPTAEAARTLFLSVWRESPERRLELLRLFPNSCWWTLPEVQSSIHAAVCPQQAPRAESAWRPLALRLEGESRSLWSRIVEDARASRTQDRLLAEVQSAVKRWPDWKAGPVLEGLIRFERGEHEPALRQLQSVLSRLQGDIEGNPQLAMDIAASLLEQPEGFEIGIALLKPTIKTQGPLRWMTAGSPAALALQACVAHQRFDEGRRMVEQTIPAWITREDQPAHSTTEVSEILVIGRALRMMNAPMHAIVLYLRTLEKTEHLPIGGYDPRTELNSQLVAAYGQLRSEAVLAYLEDPGDSLPLRIQPFVRQSEPGRGQLHCRWESQLKELSREPELAGRAIVALQRAAETQRHSTVARQLLIRLHIVCGQFDRVPPEIASLKTWLEEHPLPDRFRLEASSEVIESTSLWLIARECLGNADWKDAGRFLAERALAASRLTRRDSFEVAILQEWLRIAREQQDQETVRRLTDRLKSSTTEE